MNTRIQQALPFGESESVLIPGRGLCVLAMLFASGDVWPTVTVGFTFRFSQLCALLAMSLLALVPGARIRSFPGAFWLFAFVLWVFAELPISLYPERSAAYAVWTLMDVLMVATFVQYFGAAREFHKLFRWFILSFSLIASFGLLQFVLALFGINILVTEWWFVDRLARINGLSYEPSYFATYLIPGWVLSVYLLEKRAAVREQRRLRICAYTTTIALILSSSRTGWLMMMLWLFMRCGLFIWRTLSAGRLTQRSAVRSGIAIAALAVSGVLATAFAETLLSHVDDVSILAQGLGVLDQPSHSANDRSDALGNTWRAALARPILGAGIGSAPVEVATQGGETVLSLEDAKEHEGFCVILEIVASTGIIGLSLLALVWRSIAGRLRRVSARVGESDRYMLRGLAWSMGWMVLAMLFNQNFLRLYIFVDLAVLLCCIASLEPEA